MSPRPASVPITRCISSSDKAKLMGGTLTLIYGWAPGQG
jgi:hypothetical protein